jgi:hypothetical protein
MLPLLLVGTALARPLSLGLSLGGGSIGVPGWYQSWALMGSADLTVRLGPLEGWGALSASGFLAPIGGELSAAAPLQIEAGGGLGGRFLSAGFYLGEGISGPSWGGYGRVRFPGEGWADHFGVEGRVFSLASSGASGAVLMVRVEPRLDDRRPRGHHPPGLPTARQAPPPGPPPPNPPPPDPQPADAPPPSPAADEAHHDDPYGSTGDPPDPGAPADSHHDDPYGG